MSLSYEPIETACNINFDKRVPIGKLKNLAAFADTFSKPERYGIFRNQEEYQKALDLVSRSSMGTQNRAIFLREYILYYLLKNNKMLDIGPGDGYITQYILDKFQDITLIDANKNILDALASRFKNTENCLLNKSSIKYISNSILNVNLESKKDFILISDVLYYINNKHWTSLVEKLYGILEENGILVLILVGDESEKSDLAKYFGGKPIGFDKLAKFCIDTYGESKVKLYQSLEYFMAIGISTMMHIAGFLINDTQVSTNEKELKNYLLKNCSKQGGIYSLSTQQKYIVLSK